MTGIGRLRNVVLVVAVAACLAFVLGYRVYAYEEGIELPTSSDLEARTYQTFPELSWETVSEGTFQDDFEQYIADGIPERDDLLLANASLQRRVIELANLPFGYDVYDTYYGSDYVIVESIGGVYAKPKTTLDITVEDLNGWAASYSELIEANPDIDWVFYLCDRSSTSEANPAVALSGNAADYEYATENFIDLLPESCTIVDGAYTDFDEFAEDRFRTDHHWNIYGAMEAYDEVIEALGKDPIEFGEVFEAYSGPFWGSSARSGLVLEGDPDSVYDVEYDRSELVVTVAGEEKGTTFLDKGWAKNFTEYESDSLYDDAYDGYFHYNYGLFEIENTELDNGETLLIIGDSYTNCVERFFAESYQYVYVLDPRYYDGEALQEFIDGNGIDDVLFMTTAKNIDALVDVL